MWTFSLDPEQTPNLFSKLFGEQSPSDGWQHQIGDLADFEALKALVVRAQPEVVLHLAAQPLVRRNVLQTMFLIPAGVFNDADDVFLFPLLFFKKRMNLFVLQPIYNKPECS